MDKLLSLLGLALRAGRLEVGEESVGSAAEKHRSRLIVLALDASDHTVRRAKRIAELGDCLLTRIPATKGQLGGVLGRNACAVVAVTDIGLAAAVGDRLAVIDEERYSPLAQRLSLKARRAKERRKARSRRFRRNKQGKY